MLAILQGGERLCHRLEQFFKEIKTKRKIQIKLMYVHYIYTNLVLKSVVNFANQLISEGVAVGFFFFSLCCHF